MAIENLQIVLNETIMKQTTHTCTTVCCQWFVLHNIMDNICDIDMFEIEEEIMGVFSLSQNIQVLAEVH